MDRPVRPALHGAAEHADGGRFRRVVRAAHAALRRADSLAHRRVARLHALGCPGGRMGCAALPYNSDDYGKDLLSGVTEWPRTAKSNGPTTRSTRGSAARRSARAATTATPRR